MINYYHPKADVEKDGTKINTHKKVVAMMTMNK